MYLYVRHMGTLFLRSSYHCLFKNITYMLVISLTFIESFDSKLYLSICVFVYLCICIYVFAHQILRNIIFKVLIPSTLTEAAFVYLYLGICIWVSGGG